MTLGTATSPVRPRSRVGLTGGILVLLGLLGVAAVLSVTLGSRTLDLTAIVRALTDVTPSADQAVIVEMRIPRTILGIAVGAALALGGTLLQGVTRNPLADPGVIGITSGAAAAVVGSVLVFGALPLSTTAWFAFAGAAIATLTVFAIASSGRGGATPATVVLAGAAITAVCTSITSAIILADPNPLEELRRWQVGSLAGRYLPVVEQLGPYLVVGILAALFQARRLNALALGEDIARGLGVRVGASRALIFAIVTLLCGAATAACGPVVFIGLMVPHIARLLCGPDYRWILLYSLVLGPLLMLSCDIVARLVLPGGEIPVGVVVGLIGAPVFIVLARRRRLAEL